MCQNYINIHEKFNLQSCCICLEEQIQNDIENGNKLTEYNHCGKYYVHNSCLNNWKSNECFICRKKINENENQNEHQNENQNGNSNENDIIMMLINNNERNLQCKTCYVNFCLLINFLGIGVYLFIINN